MNGFIFHCIIQERERTFTATFCKQSSRNMQLTTRICRFDEKKHVINFVVLKLD